MEAKKYPSADLTRYKRLFFNIGMIVSLAIVTIVIEWKTFDRPELVNLGDAVAATDELLDIPVTEQPPPPPPKNVIKNVNLIEVPDVEEIQEEIQVELDIEVTDETSIQDYEMADFGEPEEEVAEEIFTIVEQQPTPAGGYQAFYDFIGNNLKYPNRARRMGIEGKVFVQFVVDKDGTLTNVSVVKGIDEECDAEAIRVLQKAPKWIAGKQRGKPVKVRMIIPITFTLYKPSSM